MIVFNCPSCNLQIKVPDQASGRTGTCPRCHVKVRVPDQELPAAPLSGGPVGAAAVPAPAAAPAPAPAAPGAQVPCPSCGEMISAQAKKCRFCGEVMASAQISCPSCGEMISAKAVQCRFCGEPLGRRGPSRYDDDDDRPRGRGTGRYPAARDGGRGRPAKRRAPRRPEKPELDKRLGDYFRGFFSKYADFSGRATRREFWMVTLCNFLLSIVGWLVAGVIGIVVGLIGAVGADPGDGGSAMMAGILIVSPLIMYIETGIYCLATICPWMALLCRRAHDAGWSGVLGVLLPLFTCSIGTWVVALMPGNEGPNEYGPDPYDPDAEGYDDEEDDYDDRRPRLRRRR